MDDLEGAAAALAKREGTNERVVVLGGGRGLACVLPALRATAPNLTVITSIAGEAVSDADERERLAGPVEDLRRALEALSDEDEALLHAMRLPLTVDGVGRRRLGDLTLTAAADALGGYGPASMWLGDQLGIDASVLPATIEPATSNVEELGPAEADAAGDRRVRRLRFAEGRTESPAGAVAAIQRARWVLLAPGGLYRSILPTCAVPDLAAVLGSTRARVVWIANLAPDSRDATEMTATDAVRALRLHGVRVDAVLHDPSATLVVDASELATLDVECVARPLQRASDPGTHDPELLGAALAGLLASRPPTRPN
jgi:uncharacterized cofD-like protein